MSRDFSIASCWSTKLRRFGRTPSVASQRASPHRGQDGGHDGRGARRLDGRGSARLGRVASVRGAAFHFGLVAHTQQGGVDGHVAVGLLDATLRVEAHRGRDGHKRCKGGGRRETGSARVTLRWTVSEMEGDLLAFPVKHWEVLVLQSTVDEETQKPSKPKEHRLHVRDSTETENKVKHILSSIFFSFFLFKQRGICHKDSRMCTQIPYRPSNFRDQ